MTPLKPASFEHFDTVKDWHNVDADVFWNEIYAAGQPAILRGHCADWDAVKQADAPNADFAKYLLSHNPNTTVNIFVGQGDMGGRYFYTDDYKGFNFAPATAPFASFLGKLLQIEAQDEALNIYAGATPTAQLLPGFDAGNASPLPPDGTPPLVWIGNAARVAPHFDSSDNIACCLRGPRTFLIYPPEQIANLYVGPIDHTMAGQPASLVDPRHVDLDAFPKYAQAESAARIAELQPGDAVFIPSLWWHYVESYDPLSVLMNYWWLAGNPGPGIASLAHAVLNLRELPPHHRAAWKVFFDHYVFGPDAPDSAAHIPDPVKGVLGAPSPERDHKIRHFLKSTLG